MSILHVHVPLICFSQPFLGLLAESIIHLSLDKVCHFYISFFVRQVCGAIVGFRLYLLLSGGAKRDQSEVLGVWNIRGLNTITANGRFDANFPFRGVFSNSKRYKRWPCWLVYVRYVQVFKNAVHQSNFFAWSLL